MKEKRNKRLACVCMVAMMGLSTLVGCAANDTVVSETESNVPKGKVVVNFEGTVAAVNDDEITLENGKTVVISSDTVFAGEPDTNNAVSEEIAVGNFIQGYTKDDPDAEVLSADKIYCNFAVQPGGGKLVINFEGKVASVEENCVTMENGEVISVTDETVYSIAGGVVENAILAEDYYIQGYVAEDESTSEMTASRIHIITY